MNEGVVSKETVVLRRWGSSIQKFGFINGVDNVDWPPYRDSVRWPIYIINSVDKTKFLKSNMADNKSYCSYFPATTARFFQNEGLKHNVFKLPLSQKSFLCFQKR